MLLRRCCCLCLPLVTALLLGGCGKSAPRIAESARQQILELGNLTEPVDLDPQIVNSQQDFNIVAALFEGLAAYDAKTCLPAPGVAERWEVSPDNLTWTFHLRHDAKWSTGDPVTAHDFVYAYHRMLSPKLGAEYAYMLFVLQHARDFYEHKITDFDQVGVHADDDFTLRLVVDQPVPYLDKLVCHEAWYPLHRATIEKFGPMDQRGSAWTRPGNLVGNGPFVLAEWKPHQIIRVTKSPTYWDHDRVRLNGINFYPIETLSTEEAMFRTGQLHITSSLPIDKIRVYKNDPKLRVFYSPSTLLGTYYFRLNVRKPPLDNVHVRRALSLAVNRQEMVDRVTLGDQPIAGHLTPPDTAGFTATANITFNPDEAKRELAEAGYPDGKGFPRLELLYNTSEGHRKIAEALQQMWRHTLGIDITLLNQEAKVYVDTMRSGNYEIARYAWIGDYLDPSAFLDTMLGDSGNNQTGWKNDEYDRVVLEADHTMDQAKRFALYQRAEQILVDESPLIPLYFYTRINLRRPEVKGWFSNLLDQHPYKGVYIEPIR